MCVRVRMPMFCFKLRLSFSDRADLWGTCVVGVVTRFFSAPVRPLQELVVRKGEGHETQSSSHKAGGFQQKIGTGCLA